MTNGFTKNPAIAQRIKRCISLIGPASTGQFRQFRERLEKRIALPALVAVSVLVLRNEVAAQTFTTLHSFTASGDGSSPLAGLLLLGNTLYGTTWDEGFANGKVFAINTDGTSFRVVHNFSADGNDGTQPTGSLIVSGDILYGTASHGGSAGYGTVFRVNIDGSGFRVLHGFTLTDGAYPSAALVLAKNTLYGTTWVSRNNGTVFAVNIDGTAFQVVHNFVNLEDGFDIASSLVLSDTTLYGTACGVPDVPFLDAGTVFAVNTDGSGFCVLNTFPSGSNQGAEPYGGVILSGNTLYGTTRSGGTNNVGTVFKVNIDGTGFTVLHDFAGIDGGSPTAPLVLAGNTLYGTASSGGSGGNGTIFQLNTDGTYFSVLHSFNATYAQDSCGCFGTNVDGATPQCALVVSGNTLYGTASAGGALGHGTVFSLSLPTAKPNINIFGQKLVLTWPTNVTGSLQCTTNLASPIWSTNVPSPVVINGQCTVTNQISGRQQFFRLSR